MAVSVTVDYTRQILAALRVAHRQGLVHRDIKPHNVLVDGEGRLKVTDFGIARAGPSQMTEEGSIIGTAQYLSPEQAQGAPVTPSSDLYSVGIVLYELLTGTVPFAGETPARDQIVGAGLKAHIVRRPSTAQPPTFVFDQDPSQGNKTPKGNSVTIFVSSGAAKVRVPDVRGDNSTDAAAAIASVGLKPDVHEVPSLKDPGTVVAQSPKPKTKVVKGSKVRINVSSGPAPVVVPPVVGIPYAQASSELQGKGFTVKRVDQDSNEPPGTVLHQDPSANTSAPKGSTVTLTVSKGPQTTQVPDVTSIDRDTATATSSCRSSTAPSARTAPCRGCSSSPASPTSARA